MTTNPMIEINHIDDIRRELVKLFAAFCNKQIDAKDLVQPSNTAGKIVSTLKLQLLYCELRGERPEIDFLSTKTMATPEQLPAPSAPLLAPVGQIKKS